MCQEKDQPGVGALQNEVHAPRYRGTQVHDKACDDFGAM